MDRQVLVGMSGGVDSSVAALLLMEDKYRVSGATMKLFESGDICCTVKKTCCALTDVEDARRVCNRLNIDHHVFNFTKAFGDEVIDRFSKGYARGDTPNPCIDCNRFVKFPLLLKRAQQLEINYIATGHYARIEFDDKTGRYNLLRGADRNKDQSYVLYAMDQHQLSRTLLPLGGKTKDDIRRLAAQYGLVTADKPESQDICFVPDGDYGGFLTEKMGLKAEPGDILDGDGRVVGRHRGAIRYTLGQRRGLGIAAEHPLYVTGKDMEHNTLTVGGQESLLSRRFLVDNPNWIAIKALEAPMEVTVMARYHDRETEAMLYPLESGRVQVCLKEPKRAVTPGQAAVFYQGDTVVGGGVIIKKDMKGEEDK